MGIPLGFAADVYNRKNFLAAGEIMKVGKWFPYDSFFKLKNATFWRIRKMLIIPKKLKNRGKFVTFSTFGILETSKIAIWEKKNWEEIQNGKIYKWTNQSKMNLLLRNDNYVF